MISRFEFSTIWLYVYILLFVSALLHTMSTAAALRSPLQMWQQRFWSVPFHVWRFWSIGTDSVAPHAAAARRPCSKQLRLPWLGAAAVVGAAAAAASAENHQRADARKHRQERKLIFVRAHRDLGICVPGKLGHFWRVPN